MRAYHHGMTDDTETVTVRANHSTPSWDDGEVLEGIERTPYIDKLLAAGRLTLISADGADTPENSPKLDKPSRNATVDKVRAYAEQEAGEPLTELTKAQLWELIDRADPGGDDA